MKQLYVIRAESTNLFKIGISENPSKRIRELQTGSAYNLSILFTIETKHASKLEKTLHRVYSNNKKIDEDNLAFGEWFHLDEKKILGLEKKCQDILEGFTILESFNNTF